METAQATYLFPCFHFLKANWTILIAVAGNQTCRQQIEFMFLKTRHFFRLRRLNRWIQIHQIKAEMIDIDQLHRFPFKGILLRHWIPLTEWNLNSRPSLIDLWLPYSRPDLLICLSSIIKLWVILRHLWSPISIFLKHWLVIIAHWHVYTALLSVVSIRWSIILKLRLGTNKLVIYSIHDTWNGRSITFANIIIAIQHYGNIWTDTLN